MTTSRPLFRSMLFTLAFVALVAMAIPMGVDATDEKAPLTIRDCWWGSAASDVTDVDGDGYASKRVLYVDVDSSVVLPAKVTVNVYYKKERALAWTLLSSIPEFSIQGSTPSDAQALVWDTRAWGASEVKGRYSFKVDLVNSQNTVVMTRDGTQDSDLDRIKFESEHEDTPLDLFIGDCWIEPSETVDEDGDDYVRQLVMKTSIFSGHGVVGYWSFTLYLRIFSRPQGTGVWNFDFQTDPFFVDFMGGENKTTVLLGANPVHSRGRYEFRFDLFAEDGTYLASRSGDDDTSLTGLLMETPDQDTPSEPTPPSCEVCFGASVYLAAEGSKVGVVVNRNNGSDGEVKVDYAVKPKTATAWEDFVPKSGTLTWGSGDASPKRVMIKIQADGVAEPKEVMHVVLSNPVGASMSTPKKAKIKIVDSGEAGPAEVDASAERMADLSRALDGDGLVWFTAQASPWEKQGGEAEDVAASGEAVPGKLSWLQTEVEGPGLLDFDWLVQGLGPDACVLLVDRKVCLTNGPGFQWTHAAIQLGGGFHKIRWVFAPESRVLQGKAFLDQVSWKPAFDDN